MLADHVVLPNGDLVPLEVASTRAARRRGLLGRDHIDGMLLLEPCRNVHTIGMQITIDVAHCVRLGPATVRVTRVVRMPPRRIGRLFARSSVVLEAAEGSFQRWSVSVGTVLMLAVH